MEEVIFPCFDSDEVREQVEDDGEIYAVLMRSCMYDPELIAMSLDFMWNNAYYLMLSDIERKDKK